MSCQNTTSNSIKWKSGFVQMTSHRFVRTAPKSQQNEMDENLIKRAAILIKTIMSFDVPLVLAEKDAAETLVESGVAPDLAFLAVKAGKILAKDTA